MSTHKIPGIEGYVFETCEKNDGHKHCITGGRKEDTWFCVLCRAKYKDIRDDEEGRL